MLLRFCLEFGDDSVQLKLQVVTPLSDNPHNRLTELRGIVKVQCNIKCFNTISLC